MRDFDVVFVHNYYRGTQHFVIAGQFGMARTGCGTFYIHAIQQPPFSG